MRFVSLHRVLTSVAVGEGVLALDFGATVAAVDISGAE
jgi:hypothetical protein